MEWQKSPAALVTLFESVVPGPPVEARQMFGYPCAFVNGNMFMGLHKDRFVLRLGAAERTALLAVDGAQPFEPMPGRPMKEYVVVPPSILSQAPKLKGWIAKALTYATALPPKVKKPKKKK
jgi:TfoX/Sxy family transcriptional regulator of competence genes